MACISAPEQYEKKYSNKYKIMEIVGQNKFKTANFIKTQKDEAQRAHCI